MALNLTKVCTSKIFLTMISAGFAFTALLFGISMDANNANAEAIQVVSEESTKAIQIVVDSNTKERQIDREDIKKILEDVGFIRGMIENDRGN